MVHEVFENIWNFGFWKSKIFYKFKSIFNGNFLFLFFFLGQLLKLEKAWMKSSGIFEVCTFPLINRGLHNIQVWEMKQCSVADFLVLKIKSHWSLTVSTSKDKYVMNIQTMFLITITSTYIYQWISYN